MLTEASFEAIVKTVCELDVSGADASSRETPQLWLTVEQAQWWGGQGSELTKTEEESSMLSDQGHDVRQSMSCKYVHHSLKKGLIQFRAWLYSLVKCHVLQAAVLWRCADFFENGMIEQNNFRKLLASLLGATPQQVKVLEGSKGFIHMMGAAGRLREDGSAHVRQFVQHCYHTNDGDLPLERDDWDLLLLLKLRYALGLETEVGSHTCMHACIHHSLTVMVFCACLGMSSKHMGAL